MITEQIGESRLSIRRQCSYGENKSETTGGKNQKVSYAAYISGKTEGNIEKETVRRDYDNKLGIRALRMPF